MPRYIDPVTCADGTRISIQANGDRARCWPESNFGPWTSFDVMVLPKGVSVLEAEGVGHVPVEEVRALIEAHGGTSDSWEGFEPASVEIMLEADYSDTLDTARYLGLDEALTALAAIIADGTANRETRECAAERARWVAGILPLA